MHDFCPLFREERKRKNLSQAELPLHSDIRWTIGHKLLEETGAKKIGAEAAGIQILNICLDEEDLMIKEVCIIKRGSRPRASPPLRRVK